MKRNAYTTFRRRKMLRVASALAGPPASKHDQYPASSEIESRGHWIPLVSMTAGNRGENPFDYVYFMMYPDGALDEPGERQRLHIAPDWR
jgi:hypothetical protein